MDLGLIAGWAARHHGVITRTQAAALGVTRSSWYRALDAGQLVRVHPGVARLHGSPVTSEQRVFAAVMAAGPGAIASHRTAAHLLGVPRPDDDPIDIIVPHARSPRVAGAVIHRPTDRQRLRPVRKQNIPCTNQLRTLVDLGAVAPESVAPAFEAFVVSGAIRPGVLGALVAAHGRKGRHGIGALRAVIDAWPLGSQIPDSVLEIEMARLLAAHRLPPARFHARLAGFEVDFHIAGTPLVIECDGWEHHVANRNQWEFDLDRGAKLAAEGYVVLHRTRDQIVFRQHETATRIRALLKQWSPTFL